MPKDLAFHKMGHLIQLLVYVLMNIAFASQEPCEAKIKKIICLQEAQICAVDSDKYGEILIEIYQKAHPVVKKTICSLNKIYILDMAALGQAGIIEDQFGNPKTAYFNIKRSLIDKNVSAEQALSWKEQKAFAVELPEFTLSPHSPKVLIPQLSALEYALTHEIGHIVDAFNRANRFQCSDRTCSDNFDPKEWQPEENSWGSLSWQNLVEVTNANSFPLLEKLCFYGCTAQLNEKDAPTFYQDFYHTQFPTLYSLVSPQEDFAESFTFEVLIKYRSLPASLKINQITYSLSDRWALNFSKSLWLQSFLESNLVYPEN